MPSTVKGAARYRHEAPLENSILASGPLRTASKKRKAKRDDAEDGDGYVDSKSSRKILKIGQELEEEERKAKQATQHTSAFAFESRFDGGESGQEDQTNYDDEEEWGDEDEIVEEIEVDPNDLHMFNKFMPAGEEPTLDLNAEPQAVEQQGTNLADLILRQIAAHEAKQSGQPDIIGGGLPDDAVELPAKVVEVYQQVGTILSRYKSGKLPK